MIELLKLRKDRIVIIAAAISVIAAVTQVILLPTDGESTAAGIETTYETTATAESTETEAPVITEGLQQSGTAATEEADGSYHETADAASRSGVFTTAPEITSQSVVFTTASEVALQPDMTSVTTTVTVSVTDGTSGSSAVSDVSSAPAGAASDNTVTVPEVISTPETTTAESSVTVTVPEVTSTSELITTESSTAVTVPEESSTPDESTTESSATETVPEESSTPELTTTESSATETAPEETSTPELTTTESSATETAPEESSTPELTTTESSATETAPEETSTPEESTTESSATETAPEESSTPELTTTESSATETAPEESSTPETTATESSSSVTEPEITSDTEEATQPEPEAPDGILYTEDGNIVITEYGYTQGENETAYNGDYVIRQREPDTAVCGFALTVESGYHVITLDGINVSGAENIISISETASAVLSGVGADNVISAVLSCAISNSGVLTMDSGKIYAEGMQYGILNCGEFAVSGGSLTAAAVLGTDSYDISTEEPITVSGGSLKLANGLLDGGIVNGYGEELECVVYEAFPSESERTFVSSSGESYVYELAEKDCAEDGLYYVWKPAEDKNYGVAVDEVNFPDDVFRDYVSESFDSDGDGYLSEEEREAVTSVDVGGTSDADGGITSLKGIEYFSGLTVLNCCYNIGLTALDVSKNTALMRLDCYNCGLAYLDISNNQSISVFNAYGNNYPIPSDYAFDTRTDPGFEDFDPYRVSDVTNAAFGDGVFTDITDDITYTYDCGQGYSETFTLVRTSSCPPTATDKLSQSLDAPLLINPPEEQNSGGEFNISDTSDGLVTDEGETEPDTDGLADVIEDPEGDLTDSGDMPVGEVLALARGRPP